MGTRGLGIFLAVAVAAVVGACAAIGPQTPQEAVRARAQERWDLIVKGELAKAYDYYSEGSRLGFTREEFVGSIRRDFFKGAKVTKVECSTAETCEVEVLTEHEFKGIRGGGQLRETWVRNGREWRYLRK